MEKSELRVRWLVLLLSCLLMIGNYYCFDNPAALKSQLQQHFNTIPKDRYEFLFVRLKPEILLHASDKCRHLLGGTESINQLHIDITCRTCCTRCTRSPTSCCRSSGASWWIGSVRG